VFSIEIYFVATYNFDGVVSIKDVPMFHNSYHPFFFGVAAILMPIILYFYFNAYNVAVEEISNGDKRVRSLKSNSYSPKLAETWENRKLLGYAKVRDANLNAFF